MYTGNKETEDKVAQQLPKPQGYKILIGVPEISDKTEGGVYMPDGLKASEETASIIGFVMELGPDAYADKDKFPHGKYCNKGDFVIFRSYSGTRFRVTGEEDEYQEFRLINDDSVEAVVEDPRGVKKA